MPGTTDNIRGAARRPVRGRGLMQPQTHLMTWAAAGAVAAFMTFSSDVSADEAVANRPATLPAAGQVAATARTDANQVGQVQQPRAFDIPAQSLTDALTLFGRQSGLQISVDAALVRGLSSPGLQGVMAPAEALRRLLEGTGFTWRFADGSTVMLARQGQAEAIALEPVRVEGRIPHESAYTRSESYRAGYATVGSRTDSRIRDVPASVQVVTQEVLDDRRQFSVTDSLTENVSGVTRDTTPAPFGDNLRIRGFVANENYLRNGVPDMEIGRKTGGTLADVERVEVLKGPASVLYGLGAPGGTVNVLTKQPLYDPFYELGATVGSYGFRRLDADVSQPFTEDAGVAARVNVAAEKTNAFVDFEEREQVSVTPTVRFDIGSKSRLAFEAHYLKRETSSIRSGLPLIGTVLTGPGGMYIPRNRNLGEPTNADSESETFRFGYRFETELNDSLTFRSQGDYANYAQSGDFYGMVAGGEAFGFGLASDNRTYGRGFFEPRGGEGDIDTADIFYADNSIVARFMTGETSHKAVAGMTYSYEDALNGNFQISGPFLLDVYDPVYTAPTGTPVIELATETVTEQYGFYAQDQIGVMDDRLKFILGIRHDSVRVDGTDELVVLGMGTPTELAFDDTQLTGRVGVVYDVTQDVSLYGSYATSYQPQQRVDENGNVIDPETGKQYEVGVKADWLGGRFTTTAAAFNLTRDNVARTVGINTSASGKQESKGIELDVSGEVMPGWQVIGSFTHMKTEVLQDTSTAEEGQPIDNTPENKFTVWTDYTIQSGDLRGLSFGGGALFMDRRRVPNTNSPAYYLPSFWRFDLAAGYEFGPLDLRLNVRNLFDTRYFIAATDANEIYDGEPLTVMLTAKLGF